MSARYSPASVEATRRQTSGAENPLGAGGDDRVAVRAIAGPFLQRRDQLGLLTVWVATTSVWTTSQLIESPYVRTGMWVTAASGSKRALAHATRSLRVMPKRDSWSQESSISTGSWVCTASSSASAGRVEDRALGLDPELGEDGLGDVEAIRTGTK